MLLGAQNVNTVQLSLVVDADIEMGGGRNTRSCATHLEEFNCITIPKETVDFQLSPVALHQLGLPNGYLLGIAVSGKESVLCLRVGHAVDRDVTQPSSQEHVHKHVQKDDGEERMLAVDTAEMSVDR